MAYDSRRRFLSAGSLYVDVDKDMKEAYEGLHKDDNLGELNWNLNSLRSEFKFKGNDILFKYYQSRLSHRFFSVLLMLNMIVNFIDSFWYFYFKSDLSFPFPAMLRLTALIVYISFQILVHHSEKWLKSKFARSIAAFAVLAAMIHAEYGGFLFTITGDKETFKWKRLRPVFYLIICNELLLPFPSRVYSSITTVLIIVSEITVTLVWPHMSDSNCQALTPSSINTSNATFVDYFDKYKFIVSDLFFYICAALIAYYIGFLLEIVVRRAFLDHRRCVESKFKLNFERDQQERLLGSCLPQHLMERVRKDIRTKFSLHMDSQNKSSISKPFTELYIEKYTNVTVLYADIVNSMLLTQSLESPQALVQTLNGLFGRFDSRAEANNCLRIKLLGDCYYCVCGIPEFDQNHALNSINMGIDMIEIIKNLREENQVNVDMRIGIHTGMVLSGLLGLKKWQFDIWSIDSMKASQMEHDGKPGYVHVTKTTLDLVPKQMRSEFYIQENNVIPGETTYLIRKARAQSSGVRHYYKQSSRSEKHSDKTRMSTGGRNSSLSTRSSRVGSMQLSKRRTAFQDRAYEEGLEGFREMMSFASQTITRAIDKMPLNIKRQYNSSHPSIEINPHFLHFIPKKTMETLELSPFKHIHTLDKEKERLFFKEKDPLFPFYLYCSAFISFAILIIRFLTLYDEHTNWDTFWYSKGTIIFYFTIIIISVSIFITHYKDYNINYYYRILIWFSITFSLILISCLETVECHVSEAVSVEQVIEGYDQNSRGQECLYKWSRYYTYSSVLALASISMFIRINLWLKFFLGTISIIITNELTKHNKCSVFLQIDEFYRKQDGKELEFFTPRLAHMQYLFVVYLMFYVIDRQLEYILRLDFLWSTKLKKERNEAKLTREVNHILLKNILPIHVAQRYLFNGPDQFSDDLYYEAYSSIAVMFAAIPNFFEYYKESANDDGIQYLAILNEIICDFDRLMIFPAFSHKIEKIKTIGSTYMAASGLQPGRASVDSVISSEEEMENLIVLIRFAMAMHKSLHRFNTQSNSSGTQIDFKLRTGIAIGPVIAGVVGSVKPQYDIWGDTVNVASRMDTNGMVDKIHTTEEVAKILINMNFEYKPYSRGRMNIKGKGELNTYLIDCDNESIEELYGLF